MMKSKFALPGLLFTALIYHFGSVAQNAQFLFINNSSAAGAASLDIEVRIIPVDTVYAKIDNIDYLHASTPVSVPSTTILKINFLQSGTTTVFYSYSNAVYNAGDFKILFLYGTASSKRFTELTGYNQSSSSSKVKYDFKHTTPTLGEIDLVVRQTAEVMANDFVYGDNTFSFNDEINATDYILDIYPYNDNTNGLFAYNFPGSSLGNEYIVLFTAGTSTANDMYMAEMNGVVTKLTATAPNIGINEPLNSEYFKIAPIPTIDQLKVELPLSGNGINGTITILNFQGQLLMRQSIQHFKTDMDISVLPKGMYVLKIENTTGVIMKKFIKE